MSQRQNMIAGGQNKTLLHPCWLAKRVAFVLLQFLFFPQAA